MPSGEDRADAQERLVMKHPFGAYNPNEFEREERQRRHIEALINSLGAGGIANGAVVPSTLRRFVPPRVQHGYNPSSGGGGSGESSTAPTDWRSGQHSPASPLASQGRAPWLSPDLINPFLSTPVDRTGPQQGLDRFTRSEW